MKISELSAATGVSVPTLKYYLREGLLPHGTAQSATQSTYAATHVERVRLIRALVAGANLSIADTKAVTTALDNPPTSWHELLGSAQQAIRPAVTRSAAPAGTPAADALVRDLGWQVEDCSPAREALEAALEQVSSGGVAVSEQGLKAYAAAMADVAAVDVDSVPTDSPEAAVRQVILGNVLVEPVLAALRRLAQEDLSSRRSR